MSVVRALRRPAVRYEKQSPIGDALPVSTNHDFEVRPAGDLPIADLLEVLSQGYGRTFDADWFAWKHREGSWGPSECVVASDDEGLLGVVFGLPWHLRLGGDHFAATRLVDGATTPRATRRGVFRRIVQCLLDGWDRPDGPAIVMATATPAARDAHVKNGATALDPITFSYRPARWSPAATETGMSVLDSFTPDPPSDAITTAWRAGALRWRLDRRSGVEYEVSRLANGDAAHGAVHHTVSRRALKVLVVSATWGPAHERTQLLRALAMRSRAPVILAPTGPGSSVPRSRVAIDRGGSLLCVWDRSAGRHRLSRSPTERPNWSLMGLDLEGVI